MTALNAQRRRVFRLLFVPGWPLIWLLVGYPLWWVIGIAAFLPALLCVPIAWHLWRARPIEIPRSFLMWIFLLAWILLSASQLQTLGNVMTYAYRGSYYLMAGLAFLYVIVLSRTGGGVTRLVRAMSIYWLALIALGLLAQIVPHLEFSSLIEPLVPADWLRNDLLRGLVHPRMANVQMVIGEPIARAAAPFPYTNWWGGNVAAVLPLVLFDISITRSHAWRRLLVGALVVAVVPVILSLNRGMWLSMAIGIVLAAVLVPERATFYHRAIAAVVSTGRTVIGSLRWRGWATVGAWAILVVGAVIAGAIALAMIDVVTTRLAGSGSAGFRLLFSGRALHLVLESPFVGYGVPQAAGRLAMRIGTQGQIWLLLVSAGFPALIAFVAWGIAALRATIVRRATEAAFWGGIVVVVVAIQLPFYNIMNIELIALMIGAALGWSRWAPDAQPQEPAT